MLPAECSSFRFLSSSELRSSGNFVVCFWQRTLPRHTHRPWCGCLFSVHPCTEIAVIERNLRTSKFLRDLKKRKEEHSAGNIQPIGHTYPDYISTNAKRKRRVKRKKQIVYSQYTAPHRKVSFSEELREPRISYKTQQLPYRDVRKRGNRATDGEFASVASGLRQIKPKFIDSLSSEEPDTFRWGAVYVRKTT